MRRIFNVSFALFVALFFLLLSSRPSYAAKATVTVNPNRVDAGKDIIIEVSGEGFGNFLLSVAADPPTGGEQMLIFSANITRNVPQCKKVSGSGSVFKEFACGITDTTAQTWIASITRNNTFAPGDYSVRLETEGQPLASTAFTVGTPLPAANPLTVTLTPPGPLNNDEDHQINIAWQPAVANKKYTITSGLFSSFIETCTASPCTTRTTIPKAVVGGEQRIVVAQEDNVSITGFATIQINAVIEPVGEPVEPPRLPRNKLIDCEPKDKDGNLSDPKFTEECKKCLLGDDLKGDPNNPKGIPTAFGCIKTAPGDLIGKLFGILLGIAGGVALLLIIYSGYRMVVSAGNPEALQGARETLTAAIVGLLFIIFSFVILEVIGVDILKIPGLR